MQATSRKRLSKILFVFESSDSTSAYVLLLEGSGKFGDFYDATTFDKYDNELKSALKRVIKLKILRIWYLFLIKESSFIIKQRKLMN